MKVFIIEDEYRIANSIKKGLEQEGFVAYTCQNGSDGYEMALAEKFDVIILDIMLPEIDGIEICTRLRKNKINTPIIMLTAKSDVDDKIKGLNAGADDYLAKPFAFEELLARIRALIRRPSHAIEWELKCADLILNPETYKVFRNGKEIYLTKREFSLLEYMIRNQNKILTKEQIVNNVWDYDSEILPNTIEQYIRYLRTKVDKDFPKLQPLIHTVRGFGYTLKNVD